MSDVVKTWKRLSVVSFAFFVPGIFGGCSASHESASMSPSVQTNGKEDAHTVIVGEFHPSFAHEPAGVDPKLVEFLDEVSKQFVSPFPTEDYLPRSVQEWEPNATQWKFDEDATKSLGGDDLVFRYGGDQAFQVNMEDEYSDMTHRWYCSWADVLEGALRNKDDELVTKVKAALDKDDPAMNHPEVDSSMKQAAHEAFKAKANDEESLTTFLRLCQPFKRQ